MALQKKPCAPVDALHEMCAVFVHFRDALDVIDFPSIFQIVLGMNWDGKYSKLCEFINNN